MKHSKILTALMLAGLCGISEVKAKSQRSEIKSLEKQRTHLQEERRESMERLRELNSRAARKAANRDEEDEAIDTDESDELSGEFNFKYVEPQRIDRDLIKEREEEAARAKVAARELARIEKEIRKQKAREREWRPDR